MGDAISTWLICMWLVLHIQYGSKLLIFFSPSEVETKNGLWNCHPWRTLLGSCPDACFLLELDGLTLIHSRQDCLFSCLEHHSSEAKGAPPIPVGSVSVFPWALDAPFSLCEHGGGMGYLCLYQLYPQNLSFSVAPASNSESLVSKEYELTQMNKR